MSDKCNECNGMQGCHDISCSKAGTLIPRRTSALEEAMFTVKQRGAVYGTAREDMARIAKMWSAYLGIHVRPEQVPACMMMVKLSRLAESPDHRDSVVDIAGYVYCYEDCINAALDEAKRFAEANTAEVSRRPCC